MRNFLNLRFSPRTEREAQLWSRLCGLVEAHGEALLGAEVVADFGHITASVEIQTPDAKRALRVWSAKESRWKRPGGHTERPLETARNEARRALGSGDFEMGDEVWTLDKISIEPYWNTSRHTHLELVFYAVALERNDLPRGAHWFSVDELAYQQAIYDGVAWQDKHDES